MAKKKEKVKIVWEADEKPEMKAEDWVGIFTFALAILITLNFSISLILTFFVACGFYMIKQTVVATKRNPKKFFRKMSKYGKILLTIWIACFFIDSFLTWLAVHYLAVAYEYNPFAVWIWATFGYFGGELIRVILFSCAIFYPLWIFNHAKSGEKRIFTAFVFSLAGLLLYGYTVIHNFLILYMRFPIG